MDRVYESQRDNNSTGRQATTSGLRDSESRGLENSRSIENLFIWQESRIFVNAIYRMMSTCKDYGFRDQIQRAAVSIMNNIKKK